MKVREVAIWLGALGLLAWQLFVPGFIGLANNGDFGKIAGRLCIGGPDHGADNFLFFRSDYIRDRGECYEAQVPSSEHALAWLASALEQRAGDPGRFDIRWLGGFHAIGWLFGYALLLLAIRPLQGVHWWIAAAASLLVFLDVAYVSYFNSFYTDAAALIGAFAMIAALPLLFERPWMAAAFGAAAFLFVTSKPQHAILVAAPVAVLVWVGWRQRRFVPVAIACALIGGAVWVVRSYPDLTIAPARFSLIFHKLLPGSATPRTDAAELGLNADDLKYIGSRAYLPGNPTEDPAWVREFGRRTSNGTMVKFYLRHPATALRFLRDDLHQEAWQIRAENLSNYRKEAGHPAGARTSRMGAWSAARTRLFQLWPAHMIVWYALLPFLAWRRGGPWAWAIGFAGVLGLGEFAVASLGDALETYRHLLLFQFFTDATIFLAAASLNKLAVNKRE
jgi:hypothetical protein